MNTIAQLATMPGREHSLKKTLDSLTGQMDIIFVILNGHKEIPRFLLEYKNVSVIRFDKNMGDQMKFYDMKRLYSKYLFTCDDDIIYPRTYAEYMIGKVEEHKCVISLHGKVYKGKCHYFKPLSKYHCLHDVQKDVLVTVGGTGVMAWRKDMIRINHTDFHMPNMADLFFAKAAKQQGVKIVVAAHQRGYLSAEDIADTIWNRTKLSGGVEETRVLRSFI